MPEAPSLGKHRSEVVRLERQAAMNPLAAELLEAVQAAQRRPRDDRLACLIGAADRIRRQQAAELREQGRSTLADTVERTIATNWVVILHGGGGAGYRLDWLI